METDEPPPNYESEIISLSNGAQLTPGEALNKVLKYDRFLENTETFSEKLYRFIHRDEKIYSKEHQELLQKLDELEQGRYQTGKMVIVSENPYLLRNTHVRYQSTTNQINL